MAANFYLTLKADGTQVSGESQDTRYSGLIEIMAYEFAGDRASAGQAGARRSSAISMRNVIFRKRIDAASPLLFKAFCQNSRIEAKLILRKSGGEMEDFGVLEFKQGVISSFKQGNLAFGGDSPEEEFELSYQTIRMEYNVQDDRTGMVSGGIEYEHVIMGA